MSKRKGGSSNGGRGNGRKPSGRDTRRGDGIRTDERDQGNRRTPKAVQSGTKPLPSKSKRLQKPTRSNPSNGGAARPYEVGKGKPPVEHQWKPGFCPNPAGRGKGNKSEETVLKEILLRRIPMPIAGKIKKVTIREGIYYRLVSDALAGNIKSANFLLSRFVAIFSDEKAASALGDDDRAILMDYLSRIETDPENNK